jgi:hypothetical protein
MMWEWVIVVMIIMLWAGSGHAIDSDITRQTMKGISGVYIVVEELQPELSRYAHVQKNHLSHPQLQREVEARLKKAGIGVLTREQWLKTPGMPVIYVNINTHEYEKYRYAYNISVELQQLVALQMNPGKKTLAGTWSLSMTGVVHIGELTVLCGNVGELVDRFARIFKTVNK